MGGEELGARARGSAVPSRLPSCVGWPEFALLLQAFCPVSARWLCRQRR